MKSINNLSIFHNGVSSSFMLEIFNRNSCNFLAQSELLKSRKDEIAEIILLQGERQKITICYLQTNQETALLPLYKPTINKNIPVLP